MTTERTGQAPTGHAPTGLRERKKRLTYQAVSDAAIAMFLERGFDRVSVAEVAAAAAISKPTLFRYFPTKGSAEQVYADAVASAGLAFTQLRAGLE
jgi:Bacterial regulatory proteins, tetR family.